MARHNTAPQLWIFRIDAEARQLSSGDGIKIYNERGEFGAKAYVTDDVPPGVVWIRDGWVGLNHFTFDEVVLTGDALSLIPFSVGQSDYGAWSRLLGAKDPALLTSVALLLKPCFRVATRLATTRNDSVSTEHSPRANERYPPTKS